MKNNRLKLFILFSIIAITVAFHSCDTEVALGARINLTGPVITITAPAPRQSVDGIFILSGNMYSDGALLRDMVITAEYDVEEPKGSNNYIKITLPFIWKYNGLYWEYSYNGGAFQPVPEEEIDNKQVKAEWTGNNERADWILPINMFLEGFQPENAQYLFTVKATDNTNQSDANSVKSRIVIFNSTPPAVNIIIPKLADKYELMPPVPPDTGSDFYNLHIIPDSFVPARQTASNIGKFVTSFFDLQYELKSENDIWALDLRFYKNGILWDTTGEDDFVYRTWISIEGEKPPVLDPSEALFPYDVIKIPNLKGPVFSRRQIPGKRMEQWEELKDTVTEKTTLHVIVRCIDAAGLVIEEDKRDLGVFIYWPDADIPWVELPGNMLNTHPPKGNDEDIFKIYPTSKIPINAFDNRGVAGVKYWIYRIDGNDESGNYGKFFFVDNAGTTTYYDSFNEIKEAGKHYYYDEKISPEPNTVFRFQFSPQELDIAISGDYYLVTEVYDEYDNKDTFAGFYRIQDLSHPVIEEPVSPFGPESLVMYVSDTPSGNIEDWSVTITGYAYDNIRIDQVAMVWINPASANFAAMSQLNFFRNVEYGSEAKPGGPGANQYGWKVTPLTPSSPPRPDIGYDSKYPNLVWNMELTPDGFKDVEGNRLQRFKYEKTIKLKDLNIAPGMMWPNETAKENKTPLIYIPLDMTNETLEDAIKKELFTDYLKSQVFVLKAMDNEGKQITITWSPQGDTLPPTVEIKSVWIERPVLDNSGNIIEGQFTSDPEENPLLISRTDPIPAITTGTKIKIEGVYNEDSIKTTSITQFRKNYFERNFHLTLNGIYLNKVISYPAGTNTNGTWQTTFIVADEGSSQDGVVKPGNLLDTLVIGVKITDPGGNPSEDSLSWPLEGDNLRLLRVGSDEPDGFYKAGDVLDIYLEFNKPVKPSTGVNLNALELHLNTAGGAAGRAVYNQDTDLKNGSANPNKDGNGSIRQYFKYIVQANQNSDHLTVTNISAGARWTFESEDLEVRTDPNPAYLGKLPVATSPTVNKSEYLRSLMGARTIRIDTIAPLPPSISIVPGTGNINRNSTLYITLEFNEDVTFDTASPPPGLNLNIRNNPNATVQTDEVMANNRRLIFTYTIDDDDYSGDAANTFGPLKITGITGGTITDLAGNVFTPTAAQNVTFSNLYVDTIRPPAPTLRLVTNDSGSYTTVATPGMDLGVVFYGNLEMEITFPTITNGKQIDSVVQYSFDAGTSWGSAAANPTVRIPLENGVNQVRARVVDKAGNISDMTDTITVDWDTGIILQSVTTAASNGKKTVDNPIPIVLNFRHPVNITGAVFKFNIGNTFVTPTVYERTFNPFVPPDSDSKPDDGAFEVRANSADYRTWTFTYYVKPNDSTNGQRLRVMSMDITAYIRESGGGNGPNISDMVLLGDSVNKVHTDKNVVIQTSAPLLANGYPRLTAGTRAADDSYETALEIRFSEPVSRGSGTISIEQDPAGYRLPAVLTEGQRARYRPVLNAFYGLADGNDLAAGEMVFDRYYEKGTAGYNADTNSPDTTTKYILKFDIDTYNIVPGTTTNDQKFAEAFRRAEAITLPINSTSIRNMTEGAVQWGLIVDLRGSNALKVVGANYIVKYSMGFVVNEVNNGCEVFDSTTYTPALTFRSATGTIQVSRPAIRTRKPQETNWTVNTPNANTPKISVTQPWQAQMRMDSRTPASQVNFMCTSNNTGNDTAATVWGGAYTSGPAVPAPGSQPAQPGDPTAGAGEAVPGTNIPAVNIRYVYGRTTTGTVSPVLIGTAAAGTGIYEGYKFRIRAAGTATVGATTYFSDTHAQEVAYRTVVVFEGTNQADYYDAATFSGGKQLWIRGGNTPTSTTITGFPLTPSDNWTTLSEAGNTDRAGIRLMSKTSGTAGNSLQTSTWQFVTWDITANAYLDIYIGDDDRAVGAINTTEIIKYGPQKYARHIGGWSPLKQYYIAYPGERRWLANGTPYFAKQGYYTFNSNFSERPDETQGP